MLMDGSRMGSCDSDSNEEEEVSSRASQSQVHERRMFGDHPSSVIRFMIFLEPHIMTMSHIVWLVSSWYSLD